MAKSVATRVSFQPQHIPTVAAILALLASLSVAVLACWKSHANARQRSECLRDLETFRTALESYWFRFHCYPEPSNAAIVNRIEKMNAAEKAEVISLPRVSSKHISLDPWSRPYAILVVPPDANDLRAADSPGFEIYSLGPNGIDEHGHGDDIILAH
jgi:hypothetical protein